MEMTPEYFVAWRKALGFTQDSLSARIKVNKFTITRWEIGARGFPPYIGLLMAAVEHDLKDVTPNDPIPQIKG